MASIMTNDMGSIFLQPAGPNGTQFWLGCHDLGDVSIPEGDITRDYCPDPTGRGKWKIMTRSQGMGGEITVDVTFPVGKTADYLEEMIAGGRRCPVGLYVNWNECGARSWANYYDRGFVLEDAILTARTFANSAMSNSDGGAPTRATRTFSFSGENVQEYYALVATRRSVVATTAMMAIRACSVDQCLGACGAPSYLGQVLYATDTAAVAAKSVLYESLDYGVTWAACAAFAADTLVDENVGAIACFPMTPTTTRVLLAKTETVAATPAAVFWTDDGGATYSANVAVGATNTEFFPFSQSLFALNRENIWACTDTGAGASGNIYKSVDGGATWTTSMTGAADSLNVIHFADENTGVAYGDTGQCYTTIDGGAHWTTKTVIAAVSIRGGLCLDQYRLWACSSAGVMYYSQDGGTTWAIRTVPLPTGSTAIAAYGAMDYIDDYVFAVGGQCTVGGNPYGFIARTWDGGMNWTSVLSPAQTAAGGVVAIDMVTTNNIFGAGTVSAATGLILQAAMS